MLLEIKEPSYYSQHHSTDDEIIKMFKEIIEYVKGTEYSEVIQMVNICPVVAPQEKLEQGLWEEDVTISKIVGVASVFKQINYEEYVNATIDERKKLIVKCIIDAVWMIKSRHGTKMNAKKFELDLTTFAEQYQSSNEEASNPEILGNFEISMNQDIFNDYVISKPMIKELVIFVKNQNRLGEYDFLTLINKETGYFIQTTLQEDGYVLELGDGKRLLKTENGHSFESIIEAFNTFYDEGNLVKKPKNWILNLFSR